LLPWVSVGDVAGALFWRFFCQLGNLRHDRLLGGGRIALGIEFARPLGVLALRLERGQPHFVDALRTGPALDLLLLALVLIGMFDFVFVNQPGFQKLLLQRDHVCCSVK
jgi:hypothetical protein